VQPGDTLAALGRRFRLPPAVLVKANGLVNPAGLYTGQQLSLPGAAPDGRQITGRMAVVQKGETLTATGRALRRQRVCAACGQRFKPRGHRVSRPAPADPTHGRRRRARPNDLPEPFQSVELHPLPITQGETLAIEVQIDEEPGVTTTLSGSFGGTPLTFAREKTRTGR
jgi:hypothetical protein